MMVNIETKKIAPEYLYEKLEIYIITYNRALLLSNTLQQLKSSPFSSCKITVLNNCSTDSTLSIAESHASNFKYFSIHTNKINIGSPANVIRAIELSKGIYTWVLCDDDDYNFSDCNDVISAILSENVDLVHVGAHKDFWKYGGIIATPSELIAKGYPYFKYCSFLPCNLFKTQRFYDSITKAYNNIHNWYPHLPFLIEFLENNDQMYISKNQIVLAGIGAQDYREEELMLNWANCASLLTHKRYKLLFLISQGIKVEKNEKNQVYRALFSYGANLIYNRNYKIIIKVLLTAGLIHSVILFSAILISPAWYLKRKLDF